MADPMVVYEVIPTEGNAPLSVDIIITSVEIQTVDLDPLAMAHYGYINSIDQLFNGFQAAHLGYFLEGSTVLVLWDFGDGTTTTNPDPMNHTYTSPGNYLMVLSLFVDGIEYTFPTLITVFSTGSYSTLGIGLEENRKSYTYGNDEAQGVGWSTNSGDGHLWPDTHGSIISIFNEENDHEQLIIDSLTGLPFVYDGRKNAASSLIAEVLER